ncbi:MAG: long-chain-fatty-acid--CoA ligase FadD13 [Acidimicrobiia bacterium]|nr:MAG: long-chain-fatty-acid--CoA ligase FadD13 [Acidimicrobiia bacterium]
MKTNIGSFLAKRARLDPTRIGLIVQGREITYREWNERSNRVASAFTSLGVRPGDRIGLLMGNSPEYLECFFGLAKIGVIIVPLNWRLAPPEIAVIARDAGITALIYGSEHATTVATMRGDLEGVTWVAVGDDVSAGDQSYGALVAAGSPDEPPIHGDGDDPLVVMFTAGTTGRPKGAVLTHNNLFYDSCTVSFSLDWRRADRVLVALPLFHIGALIYVVIDIHVGATTVLMEAFDPVAFLMTIQDRRINSFLAVPAMLNFMLQVPSIEEVDVSSVRWALCGTAPVPVPLIQAWAERGIAIQQVYGLTECTGGAAVLGADRALEKVGSTGLPMFHTDIRVVNEKGDDAAPGEVGEILISGPHVMAGYWENPTATAATLENGWLHTGDLGRLDDEGYLYIVERKKDIVISGGENIYPAEVENVLAGMPQIAEAAVIGVPDPEWGEAVCIVARLRDGYQLTLDEVVGFCEGKLGRYKLPRKLIVTDQPLPRTPTGKVLKRVLRENASG